MSGKLVETNNEIQIRFFDSRKFCFQCFDGKIKKKNYDIKWSPCNHLNSIETHKLNEVLTT